MCTVSMVAQDWQERWKQRIPEFYPNVIPNQQAFNPQDLANLLNPPAISRKEFDELKAEIESLKKLLIAAKKYDAETGQPDCEDADKIALFRGLAKMLGIDLGDVFPETVKA